MKEWHGGICILVLLIGVLSGLMFRSAPFASITLLTGIGSSMEPTISQNDVIIVVPTNPEQVKVGDMITYSRNATGGMMGIFVTHRIVHIEGGLIRTKGDAMTETDDYVVEPGDVKGKVVGTIPYAALFVRFVHTTLGYFFFILIPASLLIGMEIKTILRSDKHSHSNTRRR